MVRIVHLADSHFCETSRFEECCALHDWIADWVTWERPDAVVHAGDVYERSSTPRERLASARFFRQCASTCPVVIVKGNHDRDEDLELLDKRHLRLDATHPISVRERPDVVRIQGAAIACLPWPRKAALLAAVGNVPQELAGQAAQEALRDVMRGLRGILDEEVGSDSPTLLVGHAMVRGSITSHGQPLVGSDMELGLEDLALARCDGYALGHIHAHQAWDASGAPVVYPGSPRRTAFGEVEPKGFVVWELERGKPVRWEFVEVPATPMILIDSEWAPEHVGLPGDRVVEAGFAYFDEPEVLGSELRFRYHVASEHREAAARAAAEQRDRWLAEGAIAVKLDPIIEVTTRARAPEVARASSLTEQLEAHWESTGGAPIRREQLLDKLTQIDAA